MAGDGGRVPDVSEQRAEPRCSGSDCGFEAGHETPCGHPVIDGASCRFCGKPNPCTGCWQPITVAMFKGLCAEAGRDTTLKGDGDA